MDNSRKHKNIVLCSDGTGNRGFKNRGTNVYKIFEAVDLHSDTVEQIAYYDDGVGTESMKLPRMLGGAFGIGIKRNIRDLYTSLCRVYKQGDSIYLFGFSRGAFTVRMLAGFILDCGIVDPSKLRPDVDLDSVVKKAYSAYRHKYAAVLQRAFGRVLGKSQDKKKHEDCLNKFKSSYTTNPAEIQFIGVWDTVDAYGIPFDWVADGINWLVFHYRFLDDWKMLRKEMLCARQALAIDDQRKTFHPVMWKEDPKNPDRIKQVWFPGVHANVGGGYAKHGVSLVALDWMMREAGAEGLRFVGHDWENVKSHANQDDVVYDSRAGVSAFYRYAPRILESVTKGFTKIPLIHISAFRRIRHSSLGYAPGNLPKEFALEITHAKDEDEAEQVETFLKGNLEGETLPSKRTKSRVIIRQWNQRIFYLLGFLFALLTIQQAKSDSDGSYLAAIWTLSGKFKSPTALYQHLVVTFNAHQWLFVVLVGGCIASMILGWRLAIQIAATDYAFWHRFRSMGCNRSKNTVDDDEV